MSILWIPGTANPSDVIAGRYFSSKDNYYALGTMPNRGSVTVTPGAIAQAILFGYHDGQGVVAAVTFDKTRVLVGTTIAGTAGTMPNRSAENIHMPANAFTVWSGDRVFLQPPQGYYDGSTWVTGASPGLVASNIRNGVNILGLTGTMVEGKRSASGSSANPGSSFSVSGLAFVPYAISIEYYDSTGDYIVYRGAGGKWLWASYNGGPNGSWEYGGTSNDTWTGNGFSLSNTIGTHTLTWQAWEK